MERENSNRTMGMDLFKFEGKSFNPKTRENDLKSHRKLVCESELEI